MPRNIYLLNEEMTTKLLFPSKSCSVKDDKKMISLNPLAQFCKYLNEFLYKREGNKTSQCTHKITWCYVHAAEGAIKKFIYAIVLKLLMDYVFSNRKSIVRTLKGSGNNTNKIIKSWISSILSFSIINFAKTAIHTAKKLFSTDALVLGLFWGGYVGWFRLLQWQFRRYTNYSEGKNAVLASLISSLWLLIDKKRNRRIQIACLVFSRSLDSLMKDIDEHGSYDKILKLIGSKIPGHDLYNDKEEKQIDKGERKSPGSFEISLIMLFSCILTMYVIYTWGYEIEHFPHGIEKGMRIMTCPKPNDWNVIDKISRVRSFRFYGSPMVTSRYSHKHKF